MKKFITLFLLVSGFFIYGQSNLSYDFGADIVSRYIWRGAEFGAVGNQPATPHIQPNAALTYTFGKSSLTLGFWASYGLDSKYSENDLSLSYAVDTEIGNIAVTVADYYYPHLGLKFSDFDDDGKGAHTIEVGLSYTFPEKFPLNILITHNVLNDAPDNESLYIQASYPFSINDVDLTVFAGMANGKSAWHSVTSDNMEFVNIGFSASKSVKITDDYSIPLGMDWIYNPHLEVSYFVFKISI